MANVNFLRSNHCSACLVSYSHDFNRFNPLSPHDASFYIPENRLDFPITMGLKLKISMKLVYQYMAVFFNFSLT